MPLLNEQQLKDMIAVGENESVEFCESPKNKDKIAKNICAFSNDIGNTEKVGVFLIGVKDNKDLVGLSVTDEMIRNIAALNRDGNIQPFPIMSVKKITLSQGELIAVEVQPSKNTPVRYKGRCYIRVGSSLTTASEEEESRLTDKRQSTFLPYDMQGVPSTGESDLNILYFKDYYLPTAIDPETLEVNNRNVKTQMQSLRLIDSKGQSTVTALLIMGKLPQHWFPGAFVQFVRYEGTEITDPIKTQKEISGTVENQIQKTEDVLEANISKSLRLSDHKHIKSPDYPMTALRQFVRNAIIHRDYKSSNPSRIFWFNDRIEIHSPGAPYGEVTKHNFGQPGITAYRNPTITETMKNLGFVERFGFGISQAKKALKDNGNPEPIFKINGSFILVTIKKQKYVNNKNNT